MCAYCHDTTLRELPSPHAESCSMQARRSTVYGVMDERRGWGLIPHLRPLQLSIGCRTVALVLALVCLWWLTMDRHWA